jgi:hypothetical protein
MVLSPSVKVGMKDNLLVDQIRLNRSHEENTSNSITQSLVNVVNPTTTLPLHLTYHPDIIPQILSSWRKLDIENLINQSIKCHSLSIL